GTWDRTVLVVASDHGFAPIQHKLRAGVLLARAGLITLDADGKVSDWKAFVLPSAAQAYIYVRDAGDAETRDASAKIFTPLAGVEGSGVARVYDLEAIHEVNGDPAAALGLEAAPGWAFSDGYAGEPEQPPGQAATHGWDPRRPEMHASLV